MSVGTYLKSEAGGIQVNATKLGNTAERIVRPLNERDYRGLARTECTDEGNSVASGESNSERKNPSCDNLGQSPKSTEAKPGERDMREGSRSGW